MWPPRNHVSQLFENPVVSPLSIQCKGHYRFLIENKKKDRCNLRISKSKDGLERILSNVQPQPASGNRNGK